MNDEMATTGKPSSWFRELGKGIKKTVRFPARTWDLLAMQWVKDLLGLIFLYPEFSAKIQALVAKKMEQHAKKASPKIRPEKAPEKSPPTSDPSENVPP